MSNDESFRPTIVAALGVALFSVLDAMMKSVALAYPVSQATGMRYIAGALSASVFFLFFSKCMPTVDAILRSVPRALTNLLAGACFFFAISRLPLMDAVALSFLSPLFLSIWGWMLLKEPIHPMTVTAVLSGLVGVGLISYGQRTETSFNPDILGICAALATAALYALSMVLTRGHSIKDPLPILVLLPSVIGAALSAGPMILAWQPVSAWHCLILACVGMIGTAAYICLIWAYSNAKVGRLGMLEYTGLIWGALLGYAFFGEMPSIWNIGGAAVIVCSCILAIKVPSRII